MVISHNGINVINIKSFKLPDKDDDYWWFSYDLPTSSLHKSDLETCEIGQFLPEKEERLFWRENKKYR